MTKLPPLSSSLSRSRRPLRLGFVALTDAAPVIIAQENGYFAEQGLQVQLHRELGWATIRDKIIYGELDAAPAPAPMLWAMQLGIACPPCEVLTALVLNLHGNAVTLSRRLWEAGVRDDAALRAHIRDRGTRNPLTLGVVFPFSSHHLLLREWLNSAGIRPDRDVRLVIVPPAQMFRNLVAGTIDGFCAGEPWNTLAIREGAGWSPLCSAIRQPGHVEKVLVATRAFAEAHAAEHGALVRALYRACAWCDEPQNREPLAEIVAGARYLNMPARVIAPALTDRFNPGHGSSATVPNFHVFHRHEANLPSVARAEALQAALVTAGLLPASASPDLPRRLFREVLHREILTSTHHATASHTDPRGVSV